MDHSGNAEMKGAYRTLGLELVIHFVIMYLVMYTMIATLNEFYLNLGNVYMTLMMATPMALVMLFTMRSMFPSRRLNLVIGAASVVVFALSFYGMRAQALIGDEQFLRSMIPHHSGAILMCREAELRDPEIIRLCKEIIPAQQAEIDEMKRLLERY